MTAKPKLIKIGRQGILAKRMRIPASFFRHQQPGKPFVVLDEGDRRLMHVRTSDLETIKQAYCDYADNRSMA
ncbi:MAG: hypothetical protein WCL49_04825 [bacterium]